MVNVSDPRRDTEAYKPMAVHKKAHEPWAVYEEAHAPGFAAGW